LGSCESGRFLPNEDCFAEAAQEHGPEPAEKKRTDETTDGGIEQNVISGTFREPAGESGD
jgi:hypothetical protein